MLENWQVATVYAIKNFASTKPNTLCEHYEALKYPLTKAETHTLPYQLEDLERIIVLSNL